MTSFKNRVAVITGAASGIGLELATQLAAKGCHLALADINSVKLEEANELIAARFPGIRITSHIVNVASREAVEEFAKQVILVHSQVHLLFNNAGVTTVANTENIAYEDINWVMNINFWGVVYGTKTFLPHLMQVDEAHIINTSSLFGLIANPSQSAYNASKFAVRGFTEALKMDLVNTPVRVSCVHPGGIKTSIIDNARLKTESLKLDKATLKKEFDKNAPTTAAKAATIILNGVANNKRRIIVGNDAKWADRIGRWFPGTYEKILKLESR